MLSGLRNEHLCYRPYISAANMAVTVAKEPTFGSLPVWLPMIAAPRPLPYCVLHFDGRAACQTAGRNAERPGASDTSNLDCF